MARKKVVTTREELDGADTEIPVAAPVEEAADDLFSFEGLNEGGKYRVHKMPTKPGEGNAYCQDYTKDELSLDAIRSSWGGGKFRITAFDEKNQLAGSKQITIAELPRPVRETLPAAVVTSQSGDAAQLMLMEFIKGQNQMVAALLSRETAAPVPGPSVMEILALIKGLAPEKGSDPVEMLLKGLTLGKELGGGSGETNVLDLAGKGFDALRPLIAAQALKAQAAPAPKVTQAPPRIAPPAPVTPPEPAKAPVTEEEQKQMDIVKRLQWMKEVAQRMVVRARQDKDTELYAELFLDNLPDFITEEEVRERFSDPAAVAMLAQLEPEVASYPVWFESFRQAVLTLTEPDDEPDDTAPGETP
jgi:hypothetical protein